MDNEQLKYIEKIVLTMQAGQNGEKRLAHIFSHYTWDFHHQVVFDVNLQAGGKFQTDCVVITGKCVYVLESKNISGALRFEQNPQRLVRERESGTVDVFESPEVQVERNVMLLERWLAEHGICLPVIGAIVFTSAVHPHVIVGPKSIPSLFPKTIPVFLQQAWAATSREYLTCEEIDKVAALLEKQRTLHKYHPYPLTKRMNLTVGHIRPGVYCLNCRIVMRLVKKAWSCPSCACVEHDAHVRTLKEWFMFVKNTLTNAEACWFLQVGDRHRMKRLLKSAELIVEGTKKGTVYKWPW